MRQGFNRLLRLMPAAIVSRQKNKSNFFLTFFQIKLTNKSKSAY
jgi:hypothetical protein